MATKLRSILQYFHIPSNGYDSELTSFDDIVAYFDVVIESASTEAQNLKTQLAETRRQLDIK